MTGNQKKPKKTCNYRMHNQEPCGRKLYDNEYCIFHSSDIERKKDEFNHAFWREFNRQNSREEVNDLTGFVFPTGISFEDRTFKKKVYFSNARFSGKAKFGRAQFSSDAYFVEAQFHDEAIFWDAQFTGRAKFISGKFDKSVDFRQAHFAENAEFVNVHFSGPTKFLDTQFHENVDFNQANFSGEADFWQTEFHKEASFKGSQFSQKTHFKQAHFSGDVVFAEAQFLKETSFWEAKFFRKAEFVGAQFDAEANFVNTQFFGKTIFNQTQFNENAKFKNFSIKDYESFFMEECYFFDISGLLEFIEQNKKRFKYSNHPHKNEFLPDHFTLILGEKAAAKYALIDRKIRDDKYLLSLSKRHRWLISLWWLFANCGRGLKSFLKWGSSSLVIAILFAALYTYAIPGEFKIEVQPKEISFLYFSIVTFTTLGFGDITPITPLAQILVTIEVILGYGMLGVLIGILVTHVTRKS